MACAIHSIRSHLLRCVEHLESPFEFKKILISKIPMSLLASILELARSSVKIFLVICK